MSQLRNPPTLAAKLNAAGRNKPRVAVSQGTRTCRCGGAMKRIITCFRTGAHFWRCGSCKQRG